MWTGSKNGHYIAVNSTKCDLISVIEFDSRIKRVQIIRLTLARREGKIKSFQPNRRGWKNRNSRPRIPLSWKLRFTPRILLQVAWVRAEDQTILTLHTKVVTHNSRVSVTHDNLRTWQLRIRQLKETDRGCYMCQINTAVMKIQQGCLDVYGKATFLNSLIANDHFWHLPHL